MHQYIDNQQDFQSFLEERRSAGVQRVVLDLEADSLHHYGETLCLIQYADTEKLAIIDPLAVRDLSPLKDFIDERELWMHGADYDMSLFRRNMDWMPMHTLDTQIAARLLGAEKFGLANILESYLGVVVSKDNQKDDWTQRPLPKDMVDYALSDVSHLLELGSLFVGKLKSIGRYDWFLESCSWQQEKIAERPAFKESAWKISGSGKLSRKGLHYLKVIWKWREYLAKKRNRPSFKIIGNKPIIEWCRALQEGEELIFPKYIAPWQRDILSKELEKAAQVPDSKYPVIEKKKKMRKTQEQEKALIQILEKRDHLAKDLAIDSTLLGAKAAFEGVVYGGAPLEEYFMRWQIDLLDFEPLFSLRNYSKASQGELL